MNIKEVLEENEQEYAELLENLVIGQGVRLAHVFNRDNGTPKGGVTIAYRPLYPDFKNCRNYLVTAVYCSKDDVFSKKVGNYLALSEFDQGAYTNYNLGALPADHAGAHFKYVFGIGITDGNMR